MSETAPLAVPIPEAGRLLSMSRATAYRLVREGEMPVIKLGPTKRVPRAWIDDVLNATVADWEAS